MTVFRYSWLDIFLVTQTLLVMILPFIFASIDPGIFWWILLLPLHVLLILNLQNTSLHHHTHWPTFVDKRANSIYEILLSATSSIAPQEYRYSHFVHHKYVNDSPINGISKDVMSVFAKGHNGQIQNLWLFCYQHLCISLFKPWQFFLLRDIKPLTFMKPIQLRNEYAACIVLQCSIFVINPIYGLWLLCVVYALAQFLNFAWHYGEHWGAHDYRGDTTKDAVGIYNKWYNVLCFRSGYHQEHHHKPGVHWTQLHEITASLPNDRVKTSGMHITNVPYWAHFKDLFKL